MTNESKNFRKGKWEFYVIYAYLWSIFASNPNNPKEDGRDLPKHRDVQWREPLLTGAANNNFKPNSF
jgi:hypothetical protein